MVPYHYTTVRQVVTRGPEFIHGIQFGIAVIRANQNKTSKQVTTFASGDTQTKTGLRRLRVWLRGKFDITSQPLAAFFLRQGKQGFFFGGSTPFLSAIERNGVEKPRFKMKTT